MAQKIVGDADTPCSVSDPRERASLLLGMASGLAYICSGAAEELSEEEPQDVTEIVMVMRHVARLLGEAKECMAKSAAGAPEVVVQAHAVCSIATVDIAVETEGRFHQHWNGEITAWSLHALCDVIERAKAAVDAPRQVAEEVTHG